MKRKHSDGDHEFNPETLALGLGYEAAWSENSLKPPVFLTSTFQFSSAKEGKRFFELAYGLRPPDEGEEKGLIYSRLNNPNLQIFEERMAAWDRAEVSATFASGMAAISTTLLGLVRPGDIVLTSAPVYGGTHYLFKHVLPTYGIHVRFVRGGTDTASEMRKVAAEEGSHRVKVLFLETPANPNIAHTDIAAVADLANELRQAHGTSVVTVVDNTFLGPVFQRPIPLGADLVLYSATKFIGGHSDLIAGVVSGSKELMARVLEMRTILGTMTTPFNGWLLLRSLETVSIRMRRQAKNALLLARMLEKHPRVKVVLYPGLLKKDDPQYDLWKRQCTGAGSLISFVVDGGEEAAFEILDRFEVFRLAVSLGGTESLVEHPMSMTHADVPPDVLREFGVTEGMIRMSVGIEHLSDLKRDLRYALGSGESSPEQDVTGNLRLP
ncbi:MAG: aminotransferase class I/II-fold pyridoxal phosphate-dependent enzyme [Proteobacteria bacterium]|jgi:methionine-gamma-lyase|nr:aminotransferase class I/II-fold pyridoxal phosphate-dependent enzyme [Pseudomonadota bacterium]